ncbi:hypothetical protein [Paraliobacillus ryukyuensis]|uniref:hypothetical protein n=1 Tax=Paraliobacillus ryukyuensis TaxID=200904 RepID=UPI00117D1E97|nr:hypothetical protein [Paraliobacillus ryukyuensis]
MKENYQFVYENIILNCFRFLKFKNLYEVEVLTLYEYQLRMQAYRLSRVDHEYDMHMKAWLNNQVKGTKEQGNKQVPIYKKFTQFFDYEKRLKEIEKPLQQLTEQENKMAQAARQANQKGG